MVKHADDEKNKQTQEHNKEVMEAAKKGIEKYRVALKNLVNR